MPTIPSYLPTPRLYGHGNKRTAHNGLDPRRKHLYPPSASPSNPPLLHLLNLKCHPMPLLRPNPPRLHLLHPTRPPLQQLQILLQLPRILGDLEKPLAESFFLDLRTAPPGIPIGIDLLIR